jgi:S1-C subfamily serine protease
MTRPTSPPPRDLSLLVVIGKVVVVLAIGLGGVYWMNRKPVAPGASRTVGSATVNAPSPAITAAPPAATTPENRVASPDVPATPEPTALERVMAAAAASKRADAAAGATTEPAPTAPTGLEDVISRAMPAVVRVETATGFGSGFFIASDTILTNVHVVGANSTVTIRRLDGKTLTARVQTTAPELDLAVLRIANPDAGQATLPIDSGVQPRQGQDVVALGTPLGLQNTVTRGIVSAVRTVGGLTLVQTDAAINPGNSGGPLLDRSGQVIGITTMAMRSAVAQGLGFAVAIAHAQALLAGKRSLDQRGTPLSTLNEAMSGGGTTADADAVRDRATRSYEQAITALARRADALDERWRSFTRICYEGRIAPVAGREWFALWEPRAMQGAVSPGCTSAFSDIRRVADDVRDAVVAAGETARQADVYPGTRREILQRYKLAYTGWDR